MGGTEASKDDKEFDAKEYHEKCNKYMDANKALVKELKALKDQNQKLMIANERANRYAHVEYNVLIQELALNIEIIFSGLHTS